jgi:hypothetical protein
MSINCSVTLRWDATPTQLKALGVALWHWCNGASGNAGMYPYLDNQALADLLAGQLPASEAAAWDAGLPRVQFSVPGDPARDGAATLEGLRRALPGEGVAEVRVDGISGRLADGASRTAPARSVDSRDIQERVT